MTGVFHIIFLYLSGLLEVFIEFYFYSKFINKKGKILHILIFVLMGWIIINLQIPILMKFILLAFMLFLNGILLLKANNTTSILYAVLTVEIMQLCYGIINSITGILSPNLYPINPKIFSLIFMIAGGLFALGLSCLCYGIVLRFLEHKEGVRNQYVLMILIPLLLIFIMSEYIGYTIYGDTVTVDHTGHLLGINHFQMLVVQILGIASIFSIVYAYQKLTDSFIVSTKLSMLEQESHSQRQYVEEARAHYNSTKSLRHDMKNHILIIKGLLEDGDYEKAQAYTNEVDIAVAKLSFAFQTNNPILDILIENKAALAKSKGIDVSSSLKVPLSCTVSDMDFCIILSNALDNAIHACEKLGTEVNKYIRITSRRQADFLLIEVENSFRGGQRFKQGIGLSNIKWVAEKYGGTIDINARDRVFCLSILLIISQQQEGISLQTH